MLARPWQRNGWGRAVVQLRSILSTPSILQGTSVGPPPLQIQEPLGQYVDVASRLLQSRVQQSPLNQTLLKASRTFTHRSHKIWRRGLHCLILLLLQRLRRTTPLGYAIEGHSGERSF